MAIGWGKSFEEQVEEANQRVSDSQRAPSLTQEERARVHRIQSLMVSRSRIEQQLGKAVHPAHRQTLMKALEALEKEVEEISQLAEKH